MAGTLMPMTSLQALSRASVPTDKLILKQKPLISGIVHIGLGNFHRAHLAAYTAIAMEKSGGEWGICAYSMRNKKLVDSMNAQDNLYSVVEIGPDTEEIVIPGIHTRSLVGADAMPELIAQIANPETKIVSLTVTEAGYYISQATHGLDLSHPDIQNDIAQKVPKSIYGILAQSLKLRVANGGAALTILSCDNVSENGRKCGALLKEFVSQLSDFSDVATFINSSVTFPNSMVDRIVPGTEERHIEMAQQRLSLEDAIPVPAEKFTMWALEDNFAAGRPQWEVAGAIFTDEVEAFEVMKLRLLNGAHSLLAYLGGLKGCETIPASRFDPLIEKPLHKALFDEYLPSLTMPTGLSADQYIGQLYSRWSNTTLGDKTSRVGNDGSTKLPQRLTIPALSAIAQGREPKVLALTVSAWLMCVAPFKGFNPGEIAGQMKDPSKDSLVLLSQTSKDLSNFISRFFSESNIFSSELSSSQVFTSLVENYAQIIYSRGIDEAIAAAIS